MVVIKGGKTERLTPYKRLSDIEDNLIETKKEITLFMNFIDRFIPSKTDSNIAARVKIRSLIYEIAKMVKVQPNDLRQLISFHEISRQAFEQLQAEIYNEARTTSTLALGNVHMNETIRVIENLRHSRSDKAITLDPSTHTDSLED